MNLGLIDWTIVFIGLVILVLSATRTKKYFLSVAGFLASNRLAGRYLLCIGSGAAGSGAVNMLAIFEMYYRGGFAIRWWEQMLGPIVAIVLLSGWIVYRFRQTRALTMAQFFEMRYSKNFRIFVGILAFFAGILNFAIAPAVGGRFFIYFCGLPDNFILLGMSFSTFPIVMLFLLGISLFFTFLGGQIAILITDFLQGIFSYIFFLLIFLYLFFHFGWSNIIEGAYYSPPQESLINPFKAGDTNEFNIWFFLIWAFAIFFTHMSWQGTQGFNSAAKTPHEARMATVISGYRGYIGTATLVLIAIAAYGMMHNPKYSNIATLVSDTLSNIENPQIRKQVTVPVVFSKILPIGLLGCFCLFILGSFISSANSALHSWGCILIQDVILPFKKKNVTSQNHLLLLRLAVLSVAIVVFFFSLFFRQTSHLIMWVNITAALYAGAGAVIIGGLYWKRGTTVAAWTAMIVGLTISAAGIIIKQIDPDFFINEQFMSFTAMLSSLLSYIFVSFINTKTFDLDRILHRGKYAIKEDQVVVRSFTEGGILQRLGITKEFTMSDKFIYFFMFIWTIIWGVVFVIGTIWNLITEVPIRAWAEFWRIWTYIHGVFAFFIAIWLVIGGFRDLSSLLRRLATAKCDDLDDGNVQHQIIAESIIRDDDAQAKTNKANIEDSTDSIGNLKEVH
ncbi:MAG: hypothetical protein A2Y10_04030 [Planctomycetes bacterium GWF2_41_51]|nr:MAG: hypothetical protein A2Y10_04030 [Planctomycetes bacterium GWF2_41_51]HBG26185.1 sodium:solute symporter [Phycisphaerales bacterium]